MIKKFTQFNLYCILALSSNVIAQNGDIQKSLPAPVIPALGAVESGIYRNMFVEAGYSQTQVDQKVNSAFQQLFYGTTDTNTGQAVYFPVGTDEAYILDVNNNDVRSEGMSYGMMICVQMDKKVEFDRMWKWAHRYMRHASGARSGHFAWQCSTNGTKIDNNSASDGEEYFVTALFFAAKRWGNGAGIFNYQKEANDLLAVMQNKNVPVQLVTNFFNVNEKQIVFVPYGDVATFTDPSYHLPAFYEIWKVAADSNNTFWNDVADKSRAFFPTAAHPITGLMPDYSFFNGAPNPNYNDPNGPARHDQFQFDAYRCIMNMAFDYAWYKKSDNEKVLSKRLHTFFKSKGPNYPSLYELNGTPYTGFGTFHAAGLVACNAVGALASDDVIAWDFINDFYNSSLPTGRYRYYDGLLYMMSLLHVGGQFKAYIPSSGLGINENSIENLKSYPNPIQNTFTVSNTDVIDKVEVSTVLGKIVLSKKNNTNKVEIDFSNFDNGVYFVKVTSENKVATTKVVKQ
jgi:endo-1,4-beta-D-glucanase Y